MTITIARPNFRRALRVGLIALLLGQALSNLIQAGLLTVDIVKYTRDVHEVILSSWMISVLVSLAVIEAVLLMVMLERSGRCES